MYAHTSTPDTANNAAFERWRRYLLVVSAFFGLFGAAWVVFGSFDPFGLYKSLLAQALWGIPRLPPDAERAFSFVVAPLGATTAGYFLLVHMIVRYALPRREVWAYRAIVGALLVWFVLDTSASIFHGMLANVWLVNIPCLVIMGVPLLALRRWFRPRATQQGSAERSAPS